MLDLTGRTVLSFDCYGTLIDWETGLSAALQPLLARHGARVDAEELLQVYGQLEAVAEHGPYQTYRSILTTVAGQIGAHFGVTLTAAEAASLAESVGAWPAFADTAAALAALQRRFALAIISNVDDDLFASSARHLGVTFDWIVTAQQVGSYKPSLNTFQQALARIGRPASELVHVAQSLYHDHAPAKQLGLTTVWVDRRQGRTGAGATPPASAAPDLTVPDLATLARLAGV